MSDTPSTPSTASNPFTDAETKLVIAILKNLKDGTSIEFDADAVAAELGMKDGSSARARWNTVKRTKILVSGGGSSGSPSGDKASPGKVTKKRGPGKASPKKRAGKVKVEGNKETETANEVTEEAAAKVEEDGGEGVKAEAEEM